MPFLLTPHQIEPCPKEVQIVFGGVYIAKTTGALLVWETPKSRPHYYLPLASLRRDNVEITALPALKAGDDAEDGTERFKLAVGGKETVFTTARKGKLEGFVRFEFGEMDAWFESGSLIRCPPKSPTRRVDTSAFPLPVRVLINGTLVASARAAVVVLYETAFPPRYYLPATSVVDWSVMRSSETRTACPYKGEASYFSVDLGKGKVWRDVVWCYMYPVGESGAVAGRLAFVEGEGVQVLVGEEDDGSGK